MYETAFFDTIRPGVIASADVVVPLAYERLNHPTSVVDIGCGEGHWAQRFAALGCRVLGMDGHADPKVTGVPFCRYDLREPFHGHPGRFDLAVCLEVAEHLPPERAAGFVDDLASLADTILFSAAIPGQGGHGHLNEQWPEYWMALFGSLGYRMSGALRLEIWNDHRVENWYRQNLMVVAKYPDQYDDLFDDPRSAWPWPLVHPVLYDARRAR